MIKDRQWDRNINFRLGNAEDGARTGDGQVSRSERKRGMILPTYLNFHP